MQYIVCRVKDCAFCSQNGFCLNRMLVINEQGVCDWVIKPGWDKSVQEIMKSNYKPREPVQRIPEASVEED